LIRVDVPIKTSQANPPLAASRSWIGLQAERIGPHSCCISSLDCSPGVLWGFFRLSEEVRESGFKRNSFFRILLERPCSVRELERNGAIACGCAIPTNLFNRRRRDTIWLVSICRLLRWLQVPLWQGSHCFGTSSNSHPELGGRIRGSIIGRLVQKTHPERGRLPLLTSAMRGR
jgi:hypothetical protein